MAYVHLARMGDEEAQFPEHSCTPEPAEVSDFHGLQWLGRGPTSAAVQLLTLTRMQNCIFHPSAKHHMPEWHFHQHQDSVGQVRTITHTDRTLAAWSEYTKNLPTSR